MNEREFCTENMNAKNNTSNTNIDVLGNGDSLKIRSKSILNFWFLMVLAIIVGAFLRLYMISDQILLDDEWHGMEYVIGNSYSYLLTHFGFGATCIPMNIYRLGLLNMVGWSEMLLKAPAMTAGILSLVIVPFLIRKIFDWRIIVISTFLLAISPFLIFYSRVCRPYSIVALLGFVSIMAMYLWATEGKQKYAMIYVITSVLAIYFSLTAAIAVLAPLCCVFTIKLLHKLTGFPREPEQIVPGLPTLAFAGVSILILLSLLTGPAFVDAMQGWLSDLMKTDRITVKSLAGLASVLSGTTNNIMVMLFVVFLGIGQVLIFRKKALLGGIFLSNILLNFAALMITRPNHIYAPIVIARYIIPLFVTNFILIAFGINEVTKYLQSRLIKDRYLGTLLTNLIIAGLVASFFFTGPLLATYSGPNNFINHSAFQETYEPLNWEKSYASIFGWGPALNKKDISVFYQQLANEVQPSIIIEYPMTLGDHYNPLYYYQHFHKKRIIAGYIAQLKTHSEESKGSIYGNMHIDQVLSRIKDAGKLAFRNMIDMADIEAIKKSKAKYIILHKDIINEMNPDDPEHKAETYAPVAFLDQAYRPSFGEPVFEDDNLIVFRVFSLPKDL